MMEGQSVTLLLKDVNIGLANSLRRVIMSEIQTYAIHNVQFYENDSLLDDECIAHRLSLVVLTVNKNTTVDINDVVLSLNVECTDEFKNVTAGMIKSNNEHIVCLYPDTILTKLYKGQKINLIALAKLGKGSDHAKWSPVCGVGMEPTKEGVVLRYDTTGIMSPNVVMKSAVDILTQKLTKIESSINSI